MSDISFFNKLGQNNRDEALDFLVHNQTNVLIKINDKHFKTKILSKKNENEFAIYKFNFEEYQNDVVICSFDIKSESYFFKSNLKATSAELLLKIPFELFQLQRRNDFRVSIPPSVSYKCDIKSVNYQKAGFKAELRDLSLGGCLVSLNGADRLNIALDSEVELSLSINEFENHSIKTIAKHIHPVPANNTLQLGLKYLDPEADFLSELQSLLVQLDRIQRGKNDE